MKFAIHKDSTGALQVCKVTDMVVDDLSLVYFEDGERMYCPANSLKPLTTSRLMSLANHGLSTWGNEDD